MQQLPPEQEFCFAISDQHPATNGHFIGNPLIPGVVILEYVRIALTRLDAGLALKQVSRVKFTSPLKPDNQLIVRLSSRDGGRFRFACFDRSHTPIASGELSTQAV